MQYLRNIITTAMALIIIMLSIACKCDARCVPGNEVSDYSYMIMVTNRHGLTRPCFEYADSDYCYHAFNDPNQARRQAERMRAEDKEQTYSAVRNPYQVPAAQEPAVLKHRFFEDRSFEDYVEACVLPELKRAKGKDAIRELRRKQLHWKTMIYFLLCKNMRVQSPSDMAAIERDIMHIINGIPENAVILKDVARRSYDRTEDILLDASAVTPFTMALDYALIECLDDGI